jgi:hypothetical protein
MMRLKKMTHGSSFLCVLIAPKYRLLISGSSTQSVTHCSIQWVLMAKWVFPFKSIQHSSGAYEVLLQNGLQPSLGLVKCSDNGIPITLNIQLV